MGRNREALTPDPVEKVIRWPLPSVTDRARDSGTCPVPEVASSCFGSPKNLRVSVREAEGDLDTLGRRHRGRLRRLEGLDLSRWRETDKDGCRLASRAIITSAWGAIVKCRRAGKKATNEGIPSLRVASRSLWREDGGGQSSCDGGVVRVVLRALEPLEGLKPRSGTGPPGRPPPDGWSVPTPAGKCDRRPPTGPGLTTTPAASGTSAATSSPRSATARP
jgi:hypothetical protein